MRTPVLLLAALALCGCPMERDGTAQPADPATSRLPFPDANELIASIEQKIVMPQGAGPLASYTRIYGRAAMGMPAEDGYVYGVLDRTTDGSRGARWSEEPVSEPMDGGCAVVTLRYSLARAAFDYIRCNGEA